jgi:hypothetical protein
LALYISVDSRTNAWAPVFSGNLQMAYRMVSYLNLIILMALIVLWRFPTKMKIADRNNNGEIILLTLVTTLGLCGVILKLLHASIILPEGDRFGYPRLRHDQDELLALPGSFYSAQNYAARGKMKILSAETLKVSGNANIPVLKDDQFGEAGEVSFETKQNDAWVITNVYIFPWNHLILNGEFVPASQLAAASESLAVQIPKAGKYRLTYQFVPDPIWLILRKTSSWSIGVMLLLCGFFIVRRRGVLNRD